MANSTSFETGHTDLIHSCVFDYYGKRLATASSDRTIKVFDVQPINPAIQQQNPNSSQNQHILTASFLAHEGPIWSLCWAHPKFGSILASCSYDGRICIWKETITQSLVNPQYQQQQASYQQSSQWIKIHEEYKGEVSINSICFAPHTAGLCLAAACADGNILILTRKENNSWEKVEIFAHKGGVNSVSFAPDMKTALLLTANQATEQQPSKRLVSGGCDSAVRVWAFNEQTQQWSEQDNRNDVFAAGAIQHNDWVRDVAWAPSCGLPVNIIASASEDKTVNLYSEDSSKQQFNKVKTLNFNCPVYKVDWSIMGNILAVSLADGKIELWKEATQGEWRQINSLSDHQ